ncbi:N-acetyltransferase [Nakamurella antarctica]|uniref:N-acetyltransferase n=1 Tax=Nakamurella antarctica TaxID=1902245 RepID=A0A3G8ZX36_9ACTN|nr:GNAT family protein [Nakamurella antarctica]AZI58221.1 N-acetyltransferase [Nakamurella antarctica]
MNFLAPLTLTGNLVTLEPLQASHCEGLEAAAADGELWKLSYTSVPAPGAMAAEIDRRLALQAAGSMLPFAARHAVSGRLIGMTTYMNADPVNRRLEIGSTWNAASVHRSGTNAESKLLLLSHAFDQLECIAVEFRTHWLNQQSRGAILRLGAKQDGVLRSHVISPDGTLRDTVVFSILGIEWPAIRNELLRRLAARGAG